MKLDTIWRSRKRKSWKPNKNGTNLERSVLEEDWNKDFFYQNGWQIWKMAESQIRKILNPILKMLDRNHRCTSFKIIASVELLKRCAGSRHAVPNPIILMKATSFTLGTIDPIIDQEPVQN